jgi:hypothetical protein
MSGVRDKRRESKVGGCWVMYICMGLGVKII